jgi:alkylation response protein AidB-like acyl-CoA dehydrogenase
VVVTNVAAVTDLDQHPMLQAARQLADDLLEPSATEVDADLVPRSHLEAIGKAGLLGLVAPVADGGAAVPAAVWRRIQEVLSGADCATWFVTAQHHGPVRMLAESSAPIRSELLPQLVRGELVAGTAFAHLRGWPDRPVEATRVEGGWQFRGMAPWYTGWGLNDVLSLGGASADGEVVFGIVNARPRPGLIASAPMRMAAMTSTQTVRLALDNVVIPDSHIMQRMPIQEWLVVDRRQTVNTNPAVFGVASSALRKLRELSSKIDLGSGLAAADRLASRLASVRERSERLHETVSPDASQAERLAVRAEAQRVLVDATTALVVAGGGRSMAMTSAGQRHAREALFLLVQAQTLPAREATLDTF